MKIIGFIGSSRKEGNTAWAVNKILEGAVEQGAETQAWYFSDLDIKPCQGCLSCVKNDRCTYKKPMSYADACRVITTGAGNQFDPVIVRAFNAVKPAFWKIAQAGGSGLTPSYIQASLRTGGPEF
jgi:hypothetical protein